MKQRLTKLETPSVGGAGVVVTTAGVDTDHDTVNQDTDT